jgi:alpha-ketoglutarate-dependent taurine dioxygenase
LRRRFIEKGVMYVRNYEEGLGLNWQTVLRTNDMREAEEICRRNLMKFEWKERGRLRTVSVRPAVVRHPATNDWVWFNQAQHWHVSCLDPSAREFVESSFREEDYPRNCYYGDGTPIEDSVMAEILAVYRELEVVFPWQEGDAVVLDNLLTAHGRNAYTGERRLLVAMGEMKSYDEVETGTDAAQELSRTKSSGV